MGAIKQIVSGIFVVFAVMIATFTTIDIRPTAAAEPAPVVTPSPVPTLPPVTVADRFLAQMNQQRANAGMAPYRMDAQLAAVAQERADDMLARGYFGHEDGQGVTQYVVVLARHGVTGYEWAGENLVIVDPTKGDVAERGVALLMNSPTHRSNILDGDFTVAGVATATYQDGNVLVVTVFLTP